MQPHNPIAPTVAAELDAAVTGHAALLAQTAEFALAAIEKKPQAEQKLVAHRARVRDAEATVGERRQALQLAERRDARAEAEAHHQQRLAGFAEFEAAVAVKDKATAEYCRGAEIAQKAYLAIEAASHRMANAIPVGTRLPAGCDVHSGETRINGRSYPAPTAVLAAAELWKHAGIDRIGKSGAMPGAKAPSHEAIFNPTQIESWSESTARVNAHLLNSIRAQIEFLHRSEIEQIETERNDG